MLTEKVNTSYSELYMAELLLLFYFRFSLLLVTLVVKINRQNLLYSIFFLLFSWQQTTGRKGEGESRGVQQRFVRDREQLTQQDNKSS